MGVLWSASRRWGGSLVAALPTLFAGGPINARCQCALCWRNHVAVAQDSMRWRTAVSPDLPREGQSKVTKPLPPPPDHLLKWEGLQSLASLPWNSMWNGIYSECTERDEPEVEWRQERSAPGWPAACTSQQLDWHNKSRVDGRGGQPLSDLTEVWGGQLFRQNEIRGASFVPHHSWVEETVSSVWGKVKLIFYEK